MNERKREGKKSRNVFNGSRDISLSISYLLRRGRERERERERERDEGSRVIIISAMMIPGVCFYNAIVFLYSLSLSERLPILSPS